MKYSIVLLLSFFISTTMWSQNDCSECDKFKIVGVYDFGPPPGGNWVILLVTVTENIESHFDPHYSSMYFVNSDMDTITKPLGWSHTLPTSVSDTIPYLLELTIPKSNQDFPKEFNGNLIIVTPTGGQCASKAICKLKYDLTTGHANLNGEWSNNAILYPNPVVDVLTIETNEPIINIAIYNLLGDQLFYGNINEGKIDLSNFKNAMYTIRIDYKNGKKENLTFVKH